MNNQFQRFFPACLVLALSAFSVSSAWAGPLYQMRVASPGLVAAPTSPPATPKHPEILLTSAGGSVLSSLDFPDTSVGENSASRTINVKNVGEADLLFSDEPFSLEAPFSVTGTDCPAVLASQGSCSVSLIFSPSALQAFTGTLTVASNSTSGENTLELAGMGVAVSVVQIVAGSASTFVQKSNGVWVATGENNVGQLGLGDTIDRTRFEEVPALRGATQVIFNTAGSSVFAKLANGQWAATGANGAGQLGLGDIVHRKSFVPVPALANASHITTGSNFTFAYMGGGVWKAAGGNSQGQLGLGDTSNRPNLVDVPALTGATQVVTGANHTFAKLANGQWAATGYNIDGQLGTNDTTNRKSFVTIGALADAVQVIPGDSNTFAQLSDGTWVASGDNGRGELGLGNLTDRLVFTSIPGLTGANHVVLGALHTFARFGNGEWKSAGWGTFGQLGLGDTVNRQVFTTVPSLFGASQVDAGAHHTVARMPDGTLAVTGYNNAGQLGLGNNTSQFSFVTAQP